MRETPRVTRTWLLRIPKYRTSYPEPTNWTLFALLDFVPLAVCCVFVNAWWFDFGFVLSVAWMWIRLSRRKRRRARFCADHGHDPYRPVPERAAWKCWHCDQDLDVSGVMEVPRSAESDELRRRSQSYYSDRR
jgi:hypothetical protein